jgi:hypothetical protein
MGESHNVHGAMLLCPKPSKDHNSAEYSMNINVEFRLDCDECGSLTVKIENPEGAARETIVYCGRCGTSRGTLGALRDLADEPNLHDVLLTETKHLM